LTSQTNPSGTDGLMSQRRDGGSVRIKVSIIVPAYNAETTISAAVASLQTQTMRDWEAIIVDDASTDATPEVLRRISFGDPRFRLVRNAVNLGPAGSRNVGLRMAQGDWVALLDADDYFQNARLATLISLGERADADMVADNLVLYNETNAGRQVLFDKSKFPTARFMPFQEFIENCYFGEGTSQRSGYVFMHPIVRRAFLECHSLSYEPLARNGEDFLFYLDCLTAGARWLVTPEAMYSYHIHDGSMTDVVRNRDRAMMIRKLRALILRPAIAQNASLADALERHMRLVAYTHYSYAVKHALTKGQVRNLFIAMSIHPSAVLPALSELRRRAPRICRRAVRRVAAVRTKSERAVQMPRSLRE
jgi:succinoglycan biosynthesis protein ExoO